MCPASLWPSLHHMFDQFDYEACAVCLRGHTLSACWGQHAERCGAARLVLLAPEEWAAGAVRVKDLATREEADVPIADLV